MGINVQSIISESGCGQFEVTLKHCEALRASDDAWLFKSLAKGLARKHGMAATFMAKPYLQDAGNGMHIHFSILIYLFVYVTARHSQHSHSCFNSYASIYLHEHYERAGRVRYAVLIGHARRCAEVLEVGWTVVRHLAERGYEIKRYTICQSKVES